MASRRSRRLVQCGVRLGGIPRRYRHAAWSGSQHCLVLMSQNPANCVLNSLLTKYLIGCKAALPSLGTSRQNTPRSCWPEAEESSCTHVAGCDSLAVFISLCASQLKHAHRKQNSLCQHCKAWCIQYESCITTVMTALQASRRVAASSGRMTCVAGSWTTFNGCRCHGIICLLSLQVRLELVVASRQPS